MSQISENLSKEIAAHLFWNLVAEQGLPKTRDMLKSPRAYMKVFEGRAPAIITALTGGSLGKSEVRAYVTDVINRIKSYLESDGQESLDGAIYLPESGARYGDVANAINYAKLPVLAKMCEENPFERAGKLILRVPLPALVIVDTIPKTPIIRVDDVESAIGYDADVYFTITGYHTLGKGGYALSGICNVPLHSTDDLPIWRRIVPNMRGIYSHLSYEGESGSNKASVCEK